MIIYNISDEVVSIDFPIFEEQSDQNETEEPQNIQANSITPAEFLHCSNVVRDFAQSHGVKMFTHYLPL